MEMRGMKMWAVMFMPLQWKKWKKPRFVYNKDGSLLIYRTRGAALRRSRELDKIKATFGPTKIEGWWSPWPVWTETITDGWWVK